MIPSLYKKIFSLGIECGHLEFTKLNVHQLELKSLLSSTLIERQKSYQLSQNYCQGNQEAALILFIFFLKSKNGESAFNISDENKSLRKEIQKTLQSWDRENSFLSHSEFKEISNHFAKILKKLPISFPNLVGNEDQNKKLILKDNWIYLAQEYHQQKSILKILNNRLQKLQKTNLELLTTNLFAYSEKIFGFSLTREQTDAIERSLNQNILFISGGPGTGKTTLIKMMLYHLIQYYLEKKPCPFIYLCAPTGKAVKRLEQTLEIPTLDSNDSILQPLLKFQPQQALTLHKLLSSQRDNLTDKKIVADAIIVDESSMINLSLFHQLFLSIHPQTKLIFIGDPHQLPSIQSPSLFNDLLLNDPKNKFLPPIAHIKLSSQKRNVEKIAILSEAIVDIETNKVDNLIKSNHISLDDLFSRSTESRGSLLFCELSANPSNIQSIYSYFYRDYPTNSFDDSEKNIMEVMSYFQRKKVLCLNRFGLYGVNRANQFCLDNYQPSFLPLTIIQNDYTLNLFNGDSGLLDKKEIEPKAYFLDDSHSLRKLSISQLHHYEISFAQTVHKSQGSEFDDVLLILPPGPSPLLYRELLFTAITRAKKRLLIAGHLSVIPQILKTSSRQNLNIIQKFHSLLQEN